MEIGRIYFAECLGMLLVNGNQTIYVQTTGTEDSAELTQNAAMAMSVVNAQQQKTLQDSQMTIDPNATVVDSQMTVDPSHTIVDTQLTVDPSGTNFDSQMTVNPSLSNSDGILVPSSNNGDSAAFMTQS